MSQFTVEAILKATDSTFTKGFSQAETKVDGFNSKLGSVLKGVGKVAAAGMAAFTAATGAATVKGVKDFVGFEKGMNEVFTLLPGMSDKAMGSMSDDVKAFSKEFGTLPEEVVPALYSSISAGVPPDNVFSFLEVAQKAAVGGVTELETAVDGISSVVNAYGDDVIDAGSASDLMFTAVKKGKTTFDELSGSLFQVIPTASSLGVEFGDVTAALATMTAQGTPTSVATTQMRQALVELSKEGGKASDTFQKVSGKTFKEFIAEGGNVQDALQLMEAHAQDTGVGVNDLFSSVEAGNAVLALTGNGTESFTENLEEMQNSAGATDTAFNQMEQGLGRSFDKIKAAFSVLSINIGERVAPVVAKFADKFLEYMPAIERAVEKAMDIAYAAFDAVFNSALMQSAIDIFKDILTNASQLGESPIWQTIQNAFKRIAQAILDINLKDLVASVGEFLDRWSPLIAGIAAAFATFYTLITIIKLIAAVKTAWLAVSAALASPFVLVAIAVGTLIAIGIALWKNWETITEKAKQLHELVQGAVQAMFWGVVGFFGDMRDKAVEIFWAFDERVREIITGMRDKVIDIFWAFDTKVREVVTGMRDKVVEVFQNFDERTREIVQAMFWGVVGFFGDMRDRASEIFSNMRQAVSDRIEAVRESVLGTLERVRERMQDILWNIFDAVFNVFWDVYETIAEVLRNIFGDTNKYFDKMLSSIEDVMGDIWNFIELAWYYIQQTIENVVSFIRSLVTGDFQGMREAVSRQMDLIWSTIQSVWNTIKSLVRNVVSTIVSFVQGYLETMRSTIASKLGNIRDTFTRIWNGIRTSVSTAFTRVVSAVRNGMQRAFDAVKNFFGRFKTAGSNIIKNIADGITGAISKVTGAVKGVMKKARDLLPFSPPKDKSSPLVDIHKNGITEQIAKGIYSGEDDIDKAMRSVLDSDGYNMHESIQAQHTVRHDYGHQESMVSAQPAFISLNIGGQNFTAFVENIQSESDRQLQLNSI